MTIREQIDLAKQQELLTVEQFALLTQLHEKTIYRMLKDGTLAVVRIGRAVRIPRAAIRIARPVPAE